MGVDGTIPSWHPLLIPTHHARQRGVHLLLCLLIGWIGAPLATESAAARGNRQRPRSFCTRPVQARGGDRAQYDDVLAHCWRGSATSNARGWEDSEGDAFGTDCVAGEDGLCKPGIGLAEG